jgi:hypothetical protein
MCFDLVCYSTVFHGLELTIRTTPAKRPAPKDGQAPKAAPSAEDLAELKSSLDECTAEVKKLEVPGGPTY